MGSDIDFQSCGRVTMVKYWSSVAMPLFFIVVGFGIFALFTASDIQLLDSASFSIIPAIMSSNNKLNNALLGSAKAITAMQAAELKTAQQLVAAATARSTP